MCTQMWPERAEPTEPAALDDQFIFGLVGLALEERSTTREGGLLALDAGCTEV